MSNLLCQHQYKIILALSLLPLETINAGLWCQLRIMGCSGAHMAPCNYHSTLESITKEQLLGESTSCAGLSSIKVPPSDRIAMLKLGLVNKTVQTA